MSSAKHWRAVIDEVVKEVKERKVVNIGELATKYGYAYAYFRYFIMKQVAAQSGGCIELIRDKAIWKCE